MSYVFGSPQNTGMSYNPMLPQQQPDVLAMNGWGSGGNGTPQVGPAAGYDFSNSGGGGRTPFLSTAGQQGWGDMTVGAASGLFNAWMGMKQYGLAKDSLNEGKRQFGLNFNAQKTTTNSALEDRQRARVQSGGAYESVSSYMDRNGIKG